MTQMTYKRCSWCVASAFVLSLCGCTTIAIPNTGGTTGPTQPAYTNLSGNWEFQATPVIGAVPFPILSGSIREDTTGTNGKYGTTVALRGQQPTKCFLGSVLVPLQGSETNGSLGLYSLAISYQYVSIALTSDATYTHLTGTYGVGGGCASGNTGTLAGTRYAALTGTYSGSYTNNPAETLKFVLTQSLNDSGNGLFPVSGTASFGGISCFNQGTASINSSTVTGSFVNLVFATAGSAGTQVDLVGTIDPLASTLTVTSLTVTGGACAGALGPVTLTREM